MNNEMFERDLQKALKYAKHSLAMEGMELSKEGEMLVLARIRNEISHEEFIERAKELAQQK